MITLFACGDVVNQAREDGLICSDGIAEIIAGVDYAVCNFEAPIAGFGKPQSKAGGHLAQIPETIAGLKQQGFDLLLLANNHIMDYGFRALKATLDLASSVGLDAIGAGMSSQEAYEARTIMVRGSRVGILNACEAQFGVIDHSSSPDKAGYAWINHPRIDRLILTLKKQCDHVVLFSHAGLEHYHIPQHAWREKYRHFCDLGVDVVVGSHPHVPQGYEHWGSALILYSLGNFLFSASRYKNLEAPSFAVILELAAGKTPQFTPVCHYQKGGVVQLAPVDKRVSIDGLCELLTDNYNHLHEQMSIAAFTQLRGSLLTSLLPGPCAASLYRTVRNMCSVLLKRPLRNKELQLLHLVRNESYHFAITHALTSLLCLGEDNE